jgi:hypothetical protein
VIHQAAEDTAQKEALDGGCDGALEYLNTCSDAREHDDENTNASPD